MRVKVSIFLITIVLITISSVIFTHCRKDKYAIPVCYDTDVQPILTNKCALSGCHDVTAAGGLNLTSYNTFTSSKEKNEILEVIKEGEMPPAGKVPLTNDEKKIIYRWIARNYEKGDCNNSNTSCDTTASITYNNNIKAIFNAYCTGCHNTSSPAGGYSLDNYTGAKNCAQSGRLLGAIQWLSGYSPMPQGGNKIPDCDITKIQKWINSGMPN